MKKEINPNCPSCGKAHDEKVFIKCKACGFVPDNSKGMWKQANMGKQKGQPRWVAEDKKKQSK